MKYLVALAALFIGAAATAQISQGGQPYLWDSYHSLQSFHGDSDEELVAYRTPSIDRELLRSQDEVTDQYKEAPYRFGVEFEVALDYNNHGNWKTLANGDRIWHLMLNSPGATSMSFLFDEFELPKGVEMYIWAVNRTEFLGSYSHLNNKDFGSFAVGLIDTDLCVIELQIPAEIEANFPFHLGKIVHGYRDILKKHFVAEADRGPFGTSGNCNINVNCPEGDEWQIDNRSVALIVSGGWAVCSGALVNNTANDGTPYFLTANHCLGGENNWVFYFNHESANCTGSNGPTDQSVSGSDLKASNAGSDFGLLELSETPPADFNVQYSGWDATDDETVISAVGIHHPSGDVKKICFEEDDPYHANQGGAAVWYIDEWEDGVTEGGSSGSPLFDQNHRIIGQLYGGFAACAGTVNNGQADWYGRFGVSWDGSSSSNRLRDWLDPGNTGQLILDGWPEGFEALAIDASVNTLEGIESFMCEESIEPTFWLRNNGTETLTSATINYEINSEGVETINWTGTLEQYDQEQIDIPELDLLDGDNVFTVWVTDPNGVADENTNNNQIEFEFEAITGDAFDYTLNIILDDYGSETTWEVKQGGNVLYSGGPYQDDADQTLVTRVMCLNDGCYTFTIYDEWGDGLCCGYGEGSYELIDPMGAIVGEGGEFGDQELTVFCTDEVSIQEASRTAFGMYPNPADEIVNLTFNHGVPSESVYAIMDLSGRIIERNNIPTGMTVLEIATGDLAAGTYLISCQLGAERHIEKLVIR